MTGLILGLEIIVAIILVVISFAIGYIYGLAHNRNRDE